MQTPQDAERMRRLHGMGWSQRAIAREWAVAPAQCGGICVRAAGRPTANPGAGGDWMSSGNG
jgi:hypothetical protein